MYYSVPVFAHLACFCDLSMLANQQFALFIAEYYSVAWIDYSLFIHSYV